MSLECDLASLLQRMQPELQEGTFLFCTIAGETVPEELRPVATFREKEGLTLLLRLEEAERRGIPGTFEAAWITLTVHSDLAAVGFLATVAMALAQAGIACNAMSGFHHDHLFVPRSKADAAMTALRQLQNG
jgi:hypothetical protein